MGGTCVNRGCVPSKALLAASGRVREMQDTQHLEGFGIEVLSLSFSFSLSLPPSLPPSLSDPLSSIYMYTGSIMR